MYAAGAGAVGALTMEAVSAWAFGRSSNLSVSTVDVWTLAIDESIESGNGGQDFEDNTDSEFHCPSLASLAARAAV